MRATIVATLILFSSGSLQAQNLQDLSAIVSGPWHHLPRPTGKLEFNREIAKCRVIAEQTPVESTTPAVIQYTRFAVIINCLKAAGYEPGARVQTQPAAKRSNVKLAAFGPGAQKCSKYISDLSDEMNYISWASGYMSAVNVTSKEQVDLSGINLANQIRFLRNYCASHPDDIFLAGVISLLSELRRIQGSVNK